MRLQRAVLYSAALSTKRTGEMGDYPAAPYDNTTTTEVVTTLKKPFQFNPPTLVMGIGMA
jgi:hypothetical protein